MNHALRARHRVMTAGMGLLALGGLIAGLAVRPEPATMDALPEALRDSLPAPAGAPLRAGGDLWEGAALDTAIYPDQISLTVREPLRVPAPLVYWAPARPPVGDGGVPDGARLLGSLSGDPGQRLPLPRAEGALLIFSLGRGQVVATLSLEGLR